MLDGAADPYPGPPRAARAWTALAAALLLLAAWLSGFGHGGFPAAAGSGPVQAAQWGRPGRSGQPAAPPRVYTAHAPMPAATPVRLDIASLGIHAPLVGRNLADGTVDPPPYTTPGTAGWYRGGPAPGAAGAALIVGHVDTRTGPAVFFPLSTVRRGAPVEVTRTDGTVAEFAVEAVETVEKDHFDPARVYGSDTGRPELRLITCGGVFDRASRTYSANVVVYAALTGSRPA